MTTGCPYHAWLGGRWYLLAFVLGGVTSATVGRWLADRWTRKKQRRDLKGAFDQLPAVPSLQSLNGNDAGNNHTADGSSDTLEREQLTRNFSFFGDDGMERIRGAFVVVVGVGGVGSHAAFHLLRSGVGRLRLIDFDQVSLSSLNRHAVATRADVGTPKVLAMQRHFRAILPSTPVEACVELFSGERAEELLRDEPDYVLDCIDNIHTKVDLLRYCKEHNIKVLSSMGSACKADPSAIRLMDISETTEDKLAKAVRTRLRKHGITHGIPTVVSLERPQVQILPLHEEAEQNPQEFAALPNFRVRILPVLGTLPAMFGAAMATVALCELGGLPLPQNHPASKQTSAAMRDASKLWSDFLKREKNFPFHDDAAPLSPYLRFEDVEFVVEEMYRGRCAQSGQAAGTKLALCRWDPSKPTRLDNIVVLTREEAQQHELRVLKERASPKTVYDPAMVAFVEERLHRAAQEFYWDNTAKE